MGLHRYRYRDDHNFRLPTFIIIPILIPTIYQSSTIELPTLDSASLSYPAYTVENDGYVGGTKIGFLSINGNDRTCRRSFAPLSDSDLSAR